MDEFERISYLTDYLNQMTVKYDEGNPEISDKEWDNLYFELKALEEKTGIVMVNSPTQNIHYEVVSHLRKVDHNHARTSTGTAHSGCCGSRVGSPSPRRRPCRRDACRGANGSPCRRRGR